MAVTTDIERRFPRSDGPLPAADVQSPSRSRDKRANSDATSDTNLLLIREIVDIPPEPSSSRVGEGRWTFASSTCGSCSTLLPLLRAPCWLPLRVRVLWLLTLLAVLDHFLFPPHGLLPLRSLVLWPDHSRPAVCGWDYEASWKIGLAGGKVLTNVVFSQDSSHVRPLLTCSEVPSPPVSFVADPFLLLVDRLNRPLSHSLHPQPPAQPPAPPASTSAAYRGYLFYEMKNLVNMRGEIGVAVSANLSLTGFKHVGTALSEAFHLSYPLPLYHRESASFLLIPECHQTLSVRIYSTAAAAFPLGWALHSVPLQGRHFVDTSPVYYRGLWYIFTTVSSSLLLYTARDLLNPSSWAPHPLSPLTSFDWRISRSAGRPIIHDGRVIRFAQDDSSYYGMAVYALEVEELTPTRYRETEVAVVRPRTMLAQGRLWASQRLHHMDMTRTGGGDWIALVDGDDHAPNHEFWAREGWWRIVKDIVTLGLLAVAAHLTLTEWRRHRWPSSLADGHCSSASLLRDMHGSLTVGAASAALALRRSLHAVPCRTVGRVLRVAVLSLATVLFVIAPLYPVRCAERCAHELPSELVQELQRQESSLSLPLPPDVSARFDLSSFPSSPASLNTTALLGSVDAFNYPDSSASFPLPPLPAHPPLPPLTGHSSMSFPLPFIPFPGFTVVTASSSSYFDRLQNFVGSVHFWEPSQRVLVYDIGLTRQQRDAVACWENAELQPFPFHVYPKHVRNLYNYAWKPLMLEQAFALPNVTAVLLLDSGVELRAPHAFSDIKRAIMERGYWFARQTYNVEQRTMPQTLTWLGIDAEAVRGRPFCAGGLHGFMKASLAYHEVALKAFECAKSEGCIAPAGSGRWTHNFDQSVMSALVYATGRRCDSRRSYREETMSATTADEADFNADVVLLLRRWHQPRPYVRHIRGLRSALCPFIHSTKRALIDYPPAAAIDALALSGSAPQSRAQMETLLIQHKDGQHLQASSPLVQCLHRHSNSRYACRQELMEHEHAVVAVVAVESRTVWAWADLHVIPHVRQLRCANTFLLALHVFALYWWAPALLRPLLATPLRVAALVGALVCLLLYSVSLWRLDAYGTDSPFAVLWYTRPRSPPSDYPPLRFNDSTPSAVDAAFPVVFSLSPQPHEMGSLNATLSSLAAQTLRPDAIFVSLPGPSHLTGTADHAVFHLSDGTWDGVALRVLRGDDQSWSLSQLALTLQAVTDPTALIIAVEADRVYSPALSSLLVHHARFDNATAFGLCGWSFLFRPAPVGVAAIHVPWSMRGHYGREVDVLQAACGAAYRRGFFPAVGSSQFAEFASPHPHCADKEEDDLWVAGWLTTRAKVRKAVLPAWDESTAKHRTLQGLEAKRAQAAPGVDMMCIRGVEQTLGPWRQLRTAH